MNFDHFLITRFNLLPQGTSGEVNEQNTAINFQQDSDAWEKWIEMRIEIFEEYCLPSILNQKNKSFSWLIYFDTNTPKKYQTFINKLNSNPLITICYADTTANFESQLKTDIASLKKHDWVITSRLDSDDLLHTDAIESIQKNFMPKEGYLIALDLGYIYKKNANKLYSHYNPRSPFLSIIEKDTINTIFVKNHSTWKQLNFSFKNILQKTKNYKIIIDKHLWMQLVHGKNVSNHVANSFPIRNSISLKDFGIDLQTQKNKEFDLKNGGYRIYFSRKLKSKALDFIFRLGIYR